MKERGKVWLSTGKKLDACKEINNLDNTKKTNPSSKKNRGNHQDMIYIHNTQKKDTQKRPPNFATKKKVGTYVYRSNQHQIN